MPFDTIDKRLATAGVITIKKQAGKNIEISDIVASSTAQSTLVFTDGVKTFTFDVPPGDAHRCPGYIFDGEADVTITNTGGSTSIYCHVWKK